MDNHLKSALLAATAVLLLATAGGATTLPTATSKLEMARRDLRISQATAARIAAELENLRRSENVSPTVIQDYETYLDRVRAMVAENRAIVKRMEAAYAARRAQRKSVAPPATTRIERMTDPSIPEENTVDALAELDREFNNSLAEFDALLLKKLDAIRANSAGKMTALAEEAAAAARRLRQKGVNPGSAGEEKGTPNGPKTGTGQKNASQGKKTGSGGKTTGVGGEPAGQGQTTVGQAAGRQSSGRGSAGPTVARQPRYDGHDDDIVARQLREAAENETDPELKKKLWKEYEDYKQNTQQPGARK